MAKTKVLALQQKFEHKPIKGYWHLWLVNHWKDIVKEQLECLKESGLYDESESIQIGALGGNKELKELQEVLEGYKKIVVTEYSTNNELFEWQTLNIIKSDADKSDSEYYVFYIHGKGTQYGKENDPVAHAGGNYWRQHMNNWTIKKWKENIAQLDIGYETCGTQMRTREWRRHYSGNYFFARSEYIKILSPILELNLLDRFECEFWACSNHPVAATLSQEFVDYYSHLPVGLSKKSITTIPTRRRIVAHTLCWNLVSQCEEAIESLYELNDKKDFQHIICDLSFPLLEGNKIPENITKAKAINTEALKDIASKYGSRYMKIRNVGVSQNWTAVARAMNIDNGDVLCGVDPDERINPECTEWLKAIGDVIHNNPEYAVASLIMKEQFATLNKSNSEERELNGINIIDVNGAMMWACIGISGKFFKELGGIPIPKEYPIYGNLEGSCLHYMNERNYKWCFLRDYLVVHNQQDKEVPLLREWKNTSIFRRQELGRQIPFEEFLDMKKIGKI